jgi:L-asparaginase/beta-aspartyl-peptidase (threonine type)
LVYIHAETEDNTMHLIVLHGGAGAVAGRDYTETEAHQGALAGHCNGMLRDGASALDVVEHAVADMESSGLYVAGRGSAPNSIGQVELDASIMEGDTRMAGAVANLRDFANPVRVARGVMEKTPHVMLAGDGAVEFARQHGFTEVTDPAAWYRLPVGGTVGAVALDGKGRLAAATSTGGTFGKLHGRVGDTPLIGPGTWADDDIAISCTGVGEHIIRAGGAAAIAFRYRSGVPLEQAVAEMLDEVKRLGGDGGVIAVTRDGEFAWPYNSEGMKRAVAGSGFDPRVATFVDDST